MTWYMSTGTDAVPGVPVAAPVTVERGAELGAALEDAEGAGLGLPGVLFVVDPHAANATAATTEAAAARPLGLVGASCIGERGYRFARRE
jgi:hypothetical protein